MPIQSQIHILAKSSSAFSGINLYQDVQTFSSASIEFSISGSALPFYQISLDKNDLVFDSTVSGSKTPRNIVRSQFKEGKALLGVGFDSSSFLQKSFEVRSDGNNEPASLVLRSNEDGRVEIGEETGRIIFARESSSFLPTKTEFFESGSSAEIFSRVIGVNGGVPYGSLVFQTNTNTGLTSGEAMEIGAGKGSGQSTGIGVGISGSLKITNLIPILELVANQSDTIAAEIRTKSTDSDQGTIILRDSGTETVRLGDDAPDGEGIALISGSGLLFVSSSEKANQDYKILVQDITSGRIYHTGSIGDINSGGTTITGLDTRILYFNGDDNPEGNAFLRYDDIGREIVLGTNDVAGIGLGAGGNDNFSNYLTTGDNFFFDTRGKTYPMARFSRLRKHFVLHPNDVSTNQGSTTTYPSLGRLTVFNDDFSLPVATIANTSTKHQRLLALNSAVAQAGLDEPFNFIDFNVQTTNNGNGQPAGAIQYYPNGYGNSFITFVGNTTNPSDKKLKKYITRSKFEINDIHKFNVVDFNWKKSPKGTPKTTGLIAQEVQENFPHLVSKVNDNLHLKTTDIIPMLIKVVQDQQHQIDELKQLIKDKLS